MNPTIKSATISAMPRSLFDPMPVITATFSDGTVKELFSYYPDELSFTPGEFVGLTEEQAHELRHQKDVRFLRS
jgi:hypothetical protein